MSKLSNFLHLKIYRRTFLLYVLIVLVFTIALTLVFHNNMVSGGLTTYGTEVDTCFSQVERQLGTVTDAIDNFFTHLYSSGTLLDDFFHFFGATPAEYARAGLETPYPQYETYLSACNSLISDSGYCIRHILHYSTYNIIDMEYSASGYSRYRLMVPEEAESLCHGGFLYTKDIRQGAAYVGKVSFVIDVSPSVEAAFCDKRGTGVYLVSGGQARILGDPAYEDLDWESLLEDGAILGRTQAPDGRNLLYSRRVSERFGCTIVSVAPESGYMGARLREMVLLGVGVILTFVLITYVYVRQFSSDSTFIKSILRSMVSAQSKDFRPVEIGTREDEFADIALHLNNLYAYLDTLIQQKYILTIRQQQTQMQMLTAQLNPHFLYNTLERIRMRALSEGAPDVAEAVADLGLVYRNIVKTEPVITLGRELEITRQYLDLMCFLYRDQFLYHCDVDDGLEEIQTPKIWMQPILENFFKHNFQNDGQLKVAVISARRDASGVRFRFFDNIGSIAEEQVALLNQQFTTDAKQKASDGIGLTNVYERLRLFYGNRVEMSIQNQKPAGVCIQVFLKNEVKESCTVC